VKQFLRSLAARTYEELDQAITHALATVTLKDIIGSFTHCCYYIAPTENRYIGKSLNTQSLYQSFAPNPESQIAKN